MQAGGKTISEGSYLHLACPYCAAYDVDRMFVASIPVDSCRCTSCGARWDEDPTTGAYRAPAERSSVIVPRGR